MKQAGFTDVCQYAVTSVKTSEFTVGAVFSGIKGKTSS